MNTYLQNPHHLVHIYQYQENILLAKSLTWGIIFLIFVVITPILIDMLATEQENSYYNNSDDVSKNDKDTFEQHSNYINKSQHLKNNAFVDKENLLNEKLAKENFLYTGINPVNGKFTQNNENDLEKNPFIEENNEHQIEINKNIEFKIYKRNKKNKTKQKKELVNNKEKQLRQDDVAITFD